MTEMVPAESRGSQSPMALALAQVSRHLSRRLPYYLKPEEAHQLIDAVESERDRLFLTVLWQTGARVSEAIAVKLGVVSRAEIRVLGKGNVDRVLFVQESLVRSILFYAREASIERNDFLFRSRKGGHITKQRANQIIKKATLKANSQRNVHTPIPPRLRHEFPKLQWPFRRASGAVGSPGHQYDPHLPPSFR